MTRKTLFAAGAAAVMAMTPAIAMAQDSLTFILNGQVPQACALSAPGETVLDLQDLTGPDGRLTAALLSSATAVQTEIPNAWCNTPSILSVDAGPLNLGAGAPAYATPNGFSRLLTYDATLSGWPADIVHRPLVGALPTATAAANAHANTLNLTIASLQTLNAAGTAEAAGLVLEAGGYSAEIAISVTVQ